AMSSSARFRSATGEACRPFQPRTVKRGRCTTAPLPRSAVLIAAATGTMRSTAGWSAEVGAALDSWPPCATRTTPRVVLAPRAVLSRSVSPLVIWLPPVPPSGRPGQANSRPYLAHSCPGGVVTDWDIVLRGGRVVDPETGLDGVRDVAVADGRIALVAAGAGASGAGGRGGAGAGGAAGVGGLARPRAHPGGAGVAAPGGGA